MSANLTLHNAYEYVLPSTFPNDSVNQALAWPLRYKGKPIAKSSFDQPFRVAALCEIT